MNRCPITYENCENNSYSISGIKKISNKITTINKFPYSIDDQINEAADRASKMSIQGVQPKLSVNFNNKAMTFKIVDQGGIYIIKPQNILYSELPQNEDLTMKLAAAIGLEIPFHGLIYCKDNSLSYFIRRFDRITGNKKIHVEDFAQLSGNTRDTKYNSSMEKVIEIIEKFCTFPQIEKVKLFKLILFNYLTGNEDMHLKNFSIIYNNNIVKISPFYDLLNTTIALKNAEEEIALPINGKRKNLTKKNLINYHL